MKLFVISDYIGHSHSGMGPFSSPHFKNKIKNHTTPKDDMKYT